ncbi:MAG: hypothetical protein WBA13_22860 [Microcoleaceae cyanobacterium]
MKQFKRIFLSINDIEIEVCQDLRGIYFVRHHVYWYIADGIKNLDPERNCIIYNLELMVNNRVNTIGWAGYQFKFETVYFDDGMEVNTVLIPLGMFEDFIQFENSNYGGTPPDNDCKLSRF